jgi:REP element-mobilizing transposase RayT
VTSRLTDSLPKSVLDAYLAEREEILQRAKRQGRDLSEDEKERLDRLHSERIETHLDAGHGECHLRRSEIAALTADSLRFFDGQRYVLHAWAIMPNHAHLVLTPLGEFSLTAILHSWKRFTAREANRLLGRTGEPFWQRESYDHLVRNDGDFDRACAYAVVNPVVAGLCKRPENWRFSSAYVAQV